MRVDSVHKCVLNSTSVVEQSSRRLIPCFINKVSASHFANEVVNGRPWN
jgi:hypothetical protein